MKRFTEALKWRDPWFLELSPDAKLAFFFVVDNCDSAGVWEPNYRLANFSIKRDIPWDDVREEFGDRVALLDSGHWWLTRFVFFQYGRLTDSCPPHKPIISLVFKHGLTIEKGIVTLALGMAKGSHTLEEKEKEKDRKGCGETNGSEHQAETIPLELGVEEDVFPENLRSDRFRQTWNDWLTYRRERRLKAYVKRGELAQLSRISEMGETRGIAAIRYSMAQNYQGVFEEKERQFQQQGNSTNNAQKPRIAENIRAAFVSPEPDNLRYR